MPTHSLKDSFEFVSYINGINTAGVIFGCIFPVYEIVSTRIQQAIDRTFLRRKTMFDLHTTKNLLVMCRNISSRMLATSMCIYRFNCPCGAGYIGRTSRKTIKTHI